MIDAATKQKIFDAANIKEVVEDYVSLQRRGVNYVGLCPFHNDNHPSFYVSPAKNFCHCFVCGEGGNPVNFLMKIENESYGDALKRLARKYNIEVVEKELTPEQIEQNRERESLQKVNEWLNTQFVNNLHNTDEGRNIGLSYFIQKRQLREDIIKKFQLGYALKQRDAYTQAAQKNGYKLDYLLKLGASIQNDASKPAYDRYYGRAIFPIHSISGQVIAFGGRTLRSDDPVKYQNSPESDVYQKRYALYGLFFAKKAIQKEKKSYIVEGYCDVLSMVQAGIENIVAPCGTALTTEQIHLLKRIIPSKSNDEDDKDVVMMYDGDGAGVHAALKNGKLLLEQGLNVYAVILPPEHDPDTFAHAHSGNEVKDYLEQNQQDYVIFFAKHFLPEIENSPIKKSNAITETAEVIAVIPNAIKRSVYVQECSKILDTKESTLNSTVEELRKKYVAEKAEKQRTAAINYRNEKNGGTSSFDKPLPPPPPVPEQPADVQNAPISAQDENGGDSAPIDVPPPIDMLPPLPDEEGQPIVNEPTPTPSQPDIRQTVEQMADEQAEQEQSQSYPFDKEESQLIRLLITQGSKPLYCLTEDKELKKTISVTQYILNELKRDNISFHNPMFNTILEEVKAHASDEGFEFENHFINHADPKISSLACEMAALELSSSKDRDLLQHVPHCVYDLQWAIVRDQEQTILQKIKHASPTDDILSLMTQKKNIDAAKIELSKRTGKVIN